MELWIIWLIAAGVLILLELFTQMVWTLCMGIGCLVAALCAGLDIDLVWQIVFAGGSAVVAYILLMPLAKRWQKKAASREDSRTGMDALLGRHGTVTEEIRPGKLGRVRIDGDSWQARLESPKAGAKRGDTVVVASYDSIILTVMMD